MMLRVCCPSAKTPLLIIAFVLLLISTFGQNDYYFSPAFRYGRIIPNHSKVNYLWQVDQYSIDLQMGKQTTGKQQWEVLHHYPDYGVALSYVKLNNTLFNHYYSLIGYMNGIFYRGENWSFQYLFGTGLSFWDAFVPNNENPDNLYIGSKINAQINLGIGAEFQIGNLFDVYGKITFSHSSNGAIKMPNLGVNTLAFQVGLKHHFKGGKELIHPIDSITSFVKKNDFYFFVAPGIRESKVNHLRYPKFGLQIGYQRQFHPLFRYGGGIDICYNGDAEAFLSPKDQNKWKYISQAMFGSFEVLYGRLVLHVSLGVYVYKSFPYYMPLYERAGFRFHFGAQQSHFAGIAIKAHGGSADCIEFTYGYRFLRIEAKNLN